jgi:pyridoxal phosphate enzyme (YggS family)
MMTALRENLQELEEAIAAACRRAGRERAEVELMAVSKTYRAGTIAEAAALGLTLFGENRVQEFAAKAAELDASLEAASSEANTEASPAASPKANPAASSAEANPPEAAPSRLLRVHLIGHLQSNKAQRAVELFDGIDSLDSLRLAERLNEAAVKLGKKLPVLIEVKLRPEESKAGLDPASAGAAELLERLPSLPHLEMRGLMTIAPFGVSEEETRACFRGLRQWRERWAAAYPRLSFEVLSMGMSGDFQLAIEEGATRIRVGTAIFGARPRL